MSFRRELIHKGLLKKQTKCNFFVLPMLGFKRNFYDPYFINSYISEYDTSEPKINLVFDNVDTDDFILQIGKLSSHKEFIGRFFEDDEVILTFSINRLYKKDFFNFLEGKYSKISDFYKDILCNHFGSKSCTDIKYDGTEVSMFDIIYPSMEKRIILANFLNVNIKLIKEVKSKPVLEDEEFFSLIELKEMYGEQESKILY